MKDMSQISDAEWQIMRILWSDAPCTASEVAGKLHSYTKWSPNTVRTLLSRLVKKKVVRFEPDANDSRVYHYYPLIGEKESMKAESRSLLKRVYGGALKVMIANLLEAEELSEEDIEELKRILDGKKDE